MNEPEGIAHVPVSEIYVGDCIWVPMYGDICTVTGVDDDAAGLWIKCGAYEHRYSPMSGEVMRVLLAKHYIEIPADEVRVGDVLFDPATPPHYSKVTQVEDHTYMVAITTSAYKGPRTKYHSRVTARPEDPIKILRAPSAPPGDV